MKRTIAIPPTKIAELPVGDTVGAITIGVIVCDKIGVGIVVDIVVGTIVKVGVAVGVRIDVGITVGVTVGATVINMVGVGV